MAGRLILAEAPRKPAPIVAPPTCDVCRAFLGVVGCQRGNYSNVWIVNATDTDNRALFLVVPLSYDGVPYSLHIINTYNVDDMADVIAIRNHLVA